MKLVSNTCSTKLSETFHAIQSASTRPSGVLITYGAPEATSVNFAFLAHVELIKSCDALEMNSEMIGCSLRRNVPANISSHVGISYVVV
jgi:hypothetical protein